MLVLAIGGHWACVQSIAWFRMTVAFSKSRPLSTALQMTFDGRHPCKLCKVVQSGRNGERDKPAKPAQAKLECLCRDGRLSVFASPLQHTAIGGDDISVSRLDPPPIPPPRFA